MSGVNTAFSEPSIHIAPSVMCADLCNLEADIRELEAAGVSMLHFDLMDAHFVPNMPIGLALIQQLRPKTDCAFDIHLMVENNDFFVDAVAEIGVQQIAVHVESAMHLDRTLSLIQARGIKAGAALDPATPLSALAYVLERARFCADYDGEPGVRRTKVSTGNSPKNRGLSCFFGRTRCSVTHRS